VRNLNLRQIAKHARVSTATASRAINRIPTVNPYLAKRVWKVIEELGYYPNTQARALVSGHSRTFGLIISELTDPFFAELVQALENVAAHDGYQILLGMSGRDSGQLESGIRRMIERRVDGVAALGFDLSEPVIRVLLSHNVPVALMNRLSPPPGVINIRIDYQNGVRQAVQHLAALRHQSIGFVTGRESLMCTRVQKNAFLDAMTEIGLGTRHDFMISGDQSIESGKGALRQLFSLSYRPTAVVCSNDLTAIGMLVQAHECGISIPHQLSIVGFDDIDLAQFTGPSLTTVKVSRADLATVVFESLVNAGTTPASTEVKEYLLPTNLVLRRSTSLAVSDVR
jgi:DNA-binding LacI/PurR family transcriptional regulator